ncbi:MAG: protein phosphatase 2C domain-containing protein [Eubacterium sp.]|nr:protein phosphatase 2C domain-containing protein [Eubacterium sp.]
MKSWKHVEYLQKGLSHLKDGSDCQDSIRVYEDKECITAALADGLGSLKASALAAQTATETVCAFFATIKEPLKRFSGKKGLADQLLKAVVSNIRKKAADSEIPLKEMDCTLVFACILKKENRALIGRLGDSTICIIAGSKSTAWNDGSESANGTNAVLDTDASDHFEIKVLNLENSGIEGFILSSDGLENELYMKGSGHVNKNAEFFFNAWYLAEDPGMFIEERIRKLTSIKNTPYDDDISIAVLSRANGSISLPEDPTWLCSCGSRNPLAVTYCQKCGKDFSVLYRNIRFKEFGGKAAFFTRINEEPEEEMRILGESAKAAAVPAPVSRQTALQNNGTNPSDLTVRAEVAYAEEPMNRNPGGNSGSFDRMKSTAGRRSEEAIGHAVSADYESDEYEGAADFADSTPLISKLIIPLILSILGLILGLLAGIAVTRSAMSRKIEKINAQLETAQAQNDELSKSLEAEELALEQKPDLPESYHLLDEGKEFWGDLDEDGLPEGEGILLEDETYYVGEFDDGKKNGDFIRMESGKDPESVTYKNDIPVKQSSKKASSGEAGSGSLSGETAGSDADIDPASAGTNTASEETGTASAGTKALTAEPKSNGNSASNPTMNAGSTKDS